MHLRRQRGTLPAMMDTNRRTPQGAQIRNTVQLAGIMAAEPRAIDAGTYAFTLAIPHERQSFTDYPPVVARWPALPAWAHAGTRVAIGGWLRTRNLTRPLRAELRTLGRRARMDEPMLRDVLDGVPADAECRPVVVEVVAESIVPLTDTP